MPVEKIEIRGFRSVRQLTLSLQQLNVISGPNGCGKSNLYKAVKLLHDAASGRLAAALAEEGGIQKVMWAGGLRRGDRRHDPKRLALAAQMDDLDYQLDIGFPEPLETSLFNLDPLVKEERIWLSGQRRRPASCIMQRQNQTAFLHNVDGERVAIRRRCILKSRCSANWVSRTAILNCRSCANGCDSGVSITSLPSGRDRRSACRRPASARRCWRMTAAISPPPGRPSSSAVIMSCSMQ